MFSRTKNHNINAAKTQKKTNVWNHQQNINCSSSIIHWLILNLFAGSTPINDSAQHVCCNKSRNIVVAAKKHMFYWL